MFRLSAPGRLRARLRAPVEDLAWMAVAGGAVLLAAAFAWLAPPLSDLYPSPTHDLFPVWRILIDPEPLEEVRSMMALAGPVLLAGVVLALGTTRPPRPALDPFVIALQVGGVVLLVIAVLKQPSGGPLLAHGYFDRYLFSAPNLIAGIAIGLVLAAVALRPPSWRWVASVREAVGRASSWRWVAFAVAILVTAIWLLPAVHTDDTVRGAGFIGRGHIPVQGDDYFAAVNGRTPLVDYISQYSNLLPLVLEPVLKAVGPSITSLSISMCVLSAIAMVAIYGAFAQVTRGAWSALALYVPWVALSLFPWNDAGAYREFNGIYNGVMPARYLGPFLLALLCAIWLRTRRVPTFALFLFAGLVLLNNYEFGIAALLALIAAVMAGWDRALPLRHRLLDLLLRGGAGLITAIALVCAITLVRTGELPDPALLTYYNRLFLRDSYGLQPMSSLGLHWALYATYAAALLIAAVRYVRAEPDRVLTGMLAFSAIFGLVTGMYFVGRSSQFQLMLLFPAWGLSLALVAWTAAHALWSSAYDPVRLRRLTVPACAALIGFGVMVSAIDRLPQPQRQIDRLSDGGHSLDLGPAERYIESVTQPGQDVLLIGTAPDHLVADKAGVVNVSPLNGEVSLFSPKEADRGIDQLEDEGGNVVIERTSALPPQLFRFAAIPGFATILRERGYTIVAEDPNLFIRVWRREAS
jgi:hypothetical protein